MSATEKKIKRDEVFSLLRAYHHQRVCRYCVMFLGEVEEAIKHDDYDANDLRDNLLETIDSACIYNVDNALTLAASDNDSAYVDAFGTDGIVEDGLIRFDRLTYAAFEADIMETLDCAGFDWDDPEGTLKDALEWFND